MHGRLLVVDLVELRPAFPPYGMADHAALGKPSVDRRYVHSAGGPVETIDAEDGRKLYELDAKGRATGVRAGSWTESYAYDSGGQLVLPPGARGRAPRAKRYERNE
ncbi:hypothetical protein [Streptomyces sp. WAC04114]|uniref:hypothetical protein n=1 Tax=Streptomyces sp. WAC04114 TaxID=2867961 RepID=UPI001C8BBAE9|nr:hypothetical protein [Streptomyces sp. WAC04114]MBX9363058.1 hypothetical protein [Streptomyces sp. WAC04114]